MCVEDSAGGGDGAQDRERRPREASDSGADLLPQAMPQAVASSCAAGAPSSVCPWQGGEVGELARWQNPEVQGAD